MDNENVAPAVVPPPPAPPKPKWWNKLRDALGEAAGQWFVNR